MNGACSSLWRRALGILLLACVPAVTGCYTLGTEVSVQALPNLDDPMHAPPVPPAIAPPREQAKVSLPVYRIEPPDEIQIEMLKMVPLLPNRLETYNVVQLQISKIVPLTPYRLQVYDPVAIDVRGTLLDWPIRSTPKDGGEPRQVDTQGVVDLGGPYGKVRVAGMTVEEAQQAITEHLKKILKYPEVSVQLAQAPSAQPAAWNEQVAADGTIKLLQYGSLRVAGMTIEEAKAAIEKYLSYFLQAPNVSVQLLQGSPIQPVNASYRVEPDGTINLRRYGTVRIAGMTVVQARLALEKHLSQYFDSPRVSVAVTGFNSKFYYVITQGAGQGDKVVKMQVTGNECVLDAISQIGGLSQLSSQNIWIARPAPPGFGCQQILPVDWVAMTEGGQTSTNYQILPGDRVFIQEDETLAWTALLGKVTGPIERVIGIAGLGASTVRNFQNLGRNSNQGGFGGGFGF